MDLVLDSCCSASFLLLSNSSSRTHSRDHINTMAIPAETNGTVPVKAKVLVPEKVSPDGLALLQKTLEVDERKGLTPEQLLEIIPNYEALIVRSETKVTAELLAAAKQLKVVARAGVGVDNVDVTAATKLGIIVVNSPSGNINAAAEHTVACKHDSALWSNEPADRLYSDDGSSEKRCGGLFKSQGWKVGAQQVHWHRAEGQNIGRGGSWQRSVTHCPDSWFQAHVMQSA